MMREPNYAAYSDEELFAIEGVPSQYWDAFKKERDKRINERREAQERAEKERFERLNAIKNELRYTEALAQEIAERISAGELLTVICRDDHMPTMRRCNQWLKEHEDFQTLFNMSIQDRLFVFEEQVIEIADDMKHDFKTVTKSGKEKRVADPDMVARAKLRIEVRFRHLKALKPQKWGEVSTLITKTDGEDMANLSTEELEKRLADLDYKNRGVRNVA
jgi:hypothetical protein